MKLSGLLRIHSRGGGGETYYFHEKKIPVTGPQIQGADTLSPPTFFAFISENKNRYGFFREINFKTTIPIRKKGSNRFIFAYSVSLKIDGAPPPKKEFRRSSSSPTILFVFVFCF